MSHPHAFQHHSLSLKDLNSISSVLQLCKGDESACNTDVPTLSVVWELCPNMENGLLNFLQILADF